MIRHWKMRFHHSIMSHMKKSRLPLYCSVSHFDQNKGDFVPMSSNLLQLLGLRSSRIGASAVLFTNLQSSVPCDDVSHPHSTLSTAPDSSDERQRADCHHRGWQLCPAQIALLVCWDWDWKQWAEITERKGGLVPQERLYNIWVGEAEQLIAGRSQRDPSTGGFWAEVRLTPLRTGFEGDPALRQGMLWVTHQALTGLFSVNLFEGFLLASSVAPQHVREFSSTYLYLILHPPLRADAL